MKPLKTLFNLLLNQPRGNLLLQRIQHFLDLTQNMSLQQTRQASNVEIHPTIKPNDQLSLAARRDFVALAPNMNDPNGREESDHREESQERGFPTVGETFESDYVPATKGMGERGQGSIEAAREGWTRLADRV